MFQRTAVVSRPTLRLLTCSFTISAVVAATTVSLAAVTPTEILRDVSTFAILDPVGPGTALFQSDEVQITTEGFFSEESLSLVEDGIDTAEGLARQTTSIEGNFVVGTGFFESGAIIDFDNYEFAEGFGASRLFYNFDVDTPTRVSFGGVLSASGLGTTHFSLWSANEFLFYWSITDESVDIGGSQILQPGSYRLAVQSGGYGQAVEGLFSPSSGSFHFELGFDNTSSVPSVDAMLQNVSVYPNPVHDQTTIDLRSIPSVVDEVSILNVAGQVVRTLRPTGGLADWDTRNEEGTPVAPGIYFFRTGREALGRVTVLR